VSLVATSAACAKLTAIAMTPCYVSMACGAAYAYSSIAFLHFMYTVMTAGPNAPPKHAPKEGSLGAIECPVPDWMNLRVYNWAITGRVGVGKSTLINSLRGLRASDFGAAKVGVCQTTDRATPYMYSKELGGIADVVRLWDLPGSGSPEFPLETYIKNMGLRYFDGVILLTSDAFYEHDLTLMRTLRKYGVPVYIVRNKIDQAIAGNLEDYGIEADVTIGMVLAEMAGYGCPPDRTFCMAAKYPDHADISGFAELLRAMADDLVSSRPAITAEPDRSIF
jgi:small GTP-binding protein